MQLVYIPMMIRDSSSSWPGCRTDPLRLPVGFC